MIPPANCSPATSSKLTVMFTENVSPTATTGSAGARFTSAARAGKLATGLNSKAIISIFRLRLMSRSSSRVW